jgi:Tfp pilus assembly protein PilN
MARKRIIESLQRDRAEAVRLLSELAKQMPEGVYIRSLKQVGQSIHLGWLRPVQRPRFNADAQHRSVAMA